jgi:hypothetical protein
MASALSALHSILPLAFTSGINLYLTVLVVGLSIRYGWVPDIPAGLQPLASLPMLITAGVFYVLEFFADKVPFVDNVWDLIHTVIRPLGAAALTVIGVAGLELGPQIEFGMTLLAIVVALASHGGKAGTRTAVNMSSPLENLSNILISLLEDAGVAALVLLSLIYPAIANFITASLLVLIIVFVPLLLRWSWFTLRATLARLKAFVRQVDRSDILPPEHAALLDNRTPDMCTHSQAQGIRGASGRYGYLSLLGDTLAFTYNRWFRSQCWQLSLQRVEAIHIRERVLVTTLEIEYHDEREKIRQARFIFTKDRAPLVARMVQHIQERLAMRSPAP